ncbi:RsmB/NOP family class I SAM-dependent RNA methyltransferase [Halodurantibacterium flavum]|uniref:RsmB/NOP family class I SAM-dependent RNA methyltransferase n=1 Tax=Halodurantibacterium flavum TaxID=1382802 RepID=A0ABW4S4Z1_9RHOB
MAAPKDRRGGGDTSGLAARRAALALISAVLEEGRLLSDALADPRGMVAALDGQGRARAQRLALTTLRNIGRADRMLGPHLRKRPPPAIHNILRLALAEVHAEGAAPHGAVDAAVSLAREGGGAAALAGLVNAVLRKTTAAPPEVWQKLPVPDLPKWLRRPLIAAYGKPAVEAIEAAHLAGAPLDLTVPGDGPVPEGERLPNGTLRLAAGTQVTALPGYAEGTWWVQDAAAAFPAMVLAPQPGERVADLCAAPGGKTMQLAAAGAQVTAVDVSEARLARLRENLSRTGLEAEILAADVLDWVPAAPFDAVLLDAPCSATGTIRRHPDLPFVKRPEDVGSLTRLQAQLIDRAIAMLRPGGRLVYCTCSLLPEEGEDQVTAALARHRGLRAVDADVPGLAPEWRSGPGWRLRPDYWAGQGGMDGFYIALLVRDGG